MRATQAAPASTLLRRKRRVSRSRLGEEQRRRQVSGSREKTKSARCGLVRRANRAHYPRPAQPVRALPPPSSAAPLIRCVCRLPPTPLSLLSTQPRSRQISFEPALSAIAAYARITTHFSIILFIFLVVGRFALEGAFAHSPCRLWLIPTDTTSTTTRRLVMTVSFGAAIPVSSHLNLTSRQPLGRGWTGAR